MKVWVWLVVAAALMSGQARAQKLPDLPLPQPLAGAPGADGASGSTDMPVRSGATEIMTGGLGVTALAPAPVSLEEPIDPKTYICGAGDAFDLDFWGQQNFQLRLTVDLEGRAFINKVGFVAVAGKTLAEVRTQIKQKVRQNYPGLQFDITLASPRTFVVHLVDNVKRPGTYTTNPLERISSLIARAGGVTGSQRQIQIEHKNGDKTSADLVLYELTGDTHLNPRLLDGDVIRVPFADITITIDGGVRHPGAYELIKTKDLAEALQLAGGLSTTAVRTMPIRVARRNAKQQQTFTDLPFGGGTPPNVELSDGDTVYIADVSELQRSVLLVGAVVGADNLDTATTTKRLAYIEGDTVRSLIERAGGIRAPGDLRRSFILRPQKKGDPQSIEIDLDALLVRRELSADQKVQMGDTIVVPSMQHSIRVEGAVVRAGLYPFNPRFGILEYLANAGGVSRGAKDLASVRIVTNDGATLPYRSDFKLAPGDSIMVPERGFSRAEVVQLALAGAGLILSGVAITLAATR